MKKGDIVEIFEDPVERTKSEGKAKLVRPDMAPIFDDLEYWQVRFLINGIPEKGSTFGRWIKK